MFLFDAAVVLATAAESSTSANILSKANGIVSHTSRSRGSTQTAPAGGEFLTHQLVEHCAISLTQEFVNTVCTNTRIRNGPEKYL
jgi:hypothetical protein